MHFRIKNGDKGHKPYKNIKSLVRIMPRKGQF